MAVNKTWVEGSLARASVAYDTSGGDRLRRARNTPRFGWSRIAGPKFQDLFNSNTLSQYSSGGVTPATWSISGGKLSATGGSYAVLIKNGITLNDGEIHINCDQAQAGGMVARYQDSNNFYACACCDDSGAANNIILYKVINGTWISLLPSWVNVTWPRGTSKLIKFIFQGPLLEVWFDGAKIISLFDKSLKWGGAGLYHGGGSTATQFLDFTVYKSQKGIILDESTTNLLTANQASIETDLTGLTYDGADTIITKDTSQYWHGNSCLKVITSASSGYGARTVISTLSATPGQSYASSAYVRGNSGGEAIQFSLQFFNGAQVYLDQANILVTLTTTWQRFVVSMVAPAGTVYASLRVVNDGPKAQIFFVDGWQYENKSYATSFQLPGIARVSEVMTLPSSLIKRDDFSVEMIFIPTSNNPGSGIDRYLFIITADANNFYSIIYTNSGRVILRTCSLGVSQYSAASDIILQMGTPYLIQASWKNGAQSLVVQGVNLGTSSYSNGNTLPQGNFVSTLKIGTAEDGNAPAIGIYAGLRIGYGRTPSEMLADYNTGEPLKFDYKTAALVPFAGNLKAYTRRLTIETDDQGAWVLNPTGSTLLSSSDLPVTPGFTKFTDEVEGVDGEIDFGGMLTMRQFDLVCNVIKANADKFTFLRQLAYWLNSKAGYQELLWLDDIDQKCLTVRPEGNISYADKYNALRFRIPVVSKTFWESIETNWVWNGGSNYVETENRGNEVAPVLITFYDSVTNPSASINGITIQYIGTLVDGDKVEIDTGAGTAKKTTSGGVVTNVLGSITVTGSTTWPKLNPGLNYTSTSGFASIQWRDRWI